jgi:phosphatidylglycerophosphate synthase
MHHAGETEAEMLDHEARQVLTPVWDRAAVTLVRGRIPPSALTLTGLLLALAAAGAAAVQAWWWALALWLVSRVFDGLDGPVARRSGRATAHGGWLDLVSDVVAYGATLVGAAIGAPEAQLALLVLLLTYYVNITTFLAWSAAAERRRADGPDTRTFHFDRAPAEGLETIVAHAAMFAFPALIAPIAWGFAGLVAVTLVWRSVRIWRLLA